MRRGRWRSAAKLRASGRGDVETMWSEDGFVLRFPETDAPPDPELILLEPEEAAELVLRQLGSTALFAAKFREAAARALLLPRRRATGRTPLWQQRKRAYDLLSVASRYPAFPDVAGGVSRVPARCVRHAGADGDAARGECADDRACMWRTRETPSPFAASLLFSYVANYIYDGDAPLAERRAQALSIDQDQLRELLGDADLRELLDADAIEETEEQLQCAGGELQGAQRGWRARSAAAAGRFDARGAVATRCVAAGCGDAASSGCCARGGCWR